ncbi:MAG: S41 family peptidase [Bacteroidetes bacterium]|nr:S41 family peptidase [Bacteroidota bacterium]MBS1629665.1 S41 family peptidase [Bacteroidota bacterium]
MGSKLFMDDPRRPKIKAWIPLIAAVILVVGMVIGFQLRDTLRNKRDISFAVDRNDRLEQIIDLIQTHYVDSVKTASLYHDAVKGILSNLDPHTTYIPAEDLSEINEELEGSYYGIGVEFAVLRDTIVFSEIIEGGPAQKAGMQIGDKLIRVGDTLVAGRGIHSEKIVAMLRGKQQSKVEVWVKRVNKPGLKELNIYRDEVPLRSVDAALMLDPHTGYIKIDRFAANTYGEFATALKKLIKSGASSMVIDLRDNPGGYLESAVAVADEFLDDKKLIVYTQGLHQAQQRYTAVNQGMFEEGRLAILINENSASAAEILAGAIQDWDRGIIVGRRSFGKGLVQEQYELDDGSALRLTIARYYTPSGRCIQRPFSKGREAYEAAFEARFQNGSLLRNDSLSVTDTTKYYSLIHHRVLYGSGGIRPDVFVPADSGKLTHGLLYILLSDGLQNALWDYYAAQYPHLKSYHNLTAFQRDFHDEERVLQAYLNALPPAEKMLTKSILTKAQNRTYLLLQIRAQLARILFSDNGYNLISSHQDDVIQEALQMLASRRYSMLIGGQGG